MCASWRSLATSQTQPWVPCRNIPLTSVERSREIGGPPPASSPGPALWPGPRAARFLPRGASSHNKARRTRRASLPRAVSSERRLFSRNLPARLPFASHWAEVSHVPKPAAAKRSRATAGSGRAVREESGCEPGGSGWGPRACNRLAGSNGPAPQLGEERVFTRGGRQGRRWTRDCTRVFLFLLFSSFTPKEAVLLGFLKFHACYFGKLLFCLRFCICF